MPNTLLKIAAATTLVGVGLAVSLARSAHREAVLEAVPEHLRDTGLYAADGSIDPTNRPYTPQYALWSDGATKQRWIYLPGPIDARDPDAWQFPVGTKLWKQFSFGRRVETRFMLRTRAGWQYATYAWNPGGTDAVLVRGAGVDSVELAAGARHHIPGEADCRACHGNGPTPVLGFSALQLSTDRDPGAPHRETPAPGAIDLATLIARGELRGFANPAPRIAGSPVQRAALGYLHGNCGGCHRPGSPLSESLGMVLAHSVARAGEPAAATTIAQASHFMAPAPRVAPGDSAHSVLLARMQSRESLSQMPPLGTQLVDVEATRLVAAWIDQLAD